MHDLILKTPVEDLKVTHTAAGGIFLRRHSRRRFQRPLAFQDRRRNHNQPYPPTASMPPSSPTMSAQSRSRSASAGILLQPPQRRPQASRSRLHIPGNELAQVDNYDNTSSLPAGSGSRCPAHRYAISRRLKASRFGLSQTPRRQLEPSRGARRRSRSQNHRSSREVWRSHRRHIPQYPHHPNLRILQAKNFVACIEDQLNFGDPFGKEWGKMDTIACRPWLPARLAPSGMSASKSSVPVRTAQLRNRIPGPRMGSHPRAITFYCNGSRQKPRRIFNSCAARTETFASPNALYLRWAATESPHPITGCQATASTSAARRSGHPTPGNPWLRLLQTCWKTAKPGGGACCPC